MKHLTLIAALALGLSFPLSAENAPQRQIYIIVEYIEVEGSLYHDWMFENRITGEGHRLREAAQGWLKDRKASVIETSIVTARSGQRAKTESLRERIYPSEPGVPGVPNEVDLDGSKTTPPLERSIPTAFETRDVGTTLEVDPVIGADDVTIDLNLSSEIIRENGMLDWPPDNAIPFFTVSLPRFYTMKTTTQVTVRNGRYALLGTCRPLESAEKKRKNPIVLIFARGDIGSIESPSEEPSEE